MAVAAGDKHVLAVSSEGSVFSFGDNSLGACGVGLQFQSLRSPRRVHGIDSPALQVSAGTNHSAVVTDSGDLFMFGCGRKGRLGLGGHENQHTPAKVPRSVFGGQGVSMASCGAVFTVVLSKAGDVVMFGDPCEQAASDAEHLPRMLQRSCFDGDGIVFVSAGNYHVAALSKAGNVYTWGRGFAGQLGLGDKEDRADPAKINMADLSGERAEFVSAGCNQTLVSTAGKLFFTWGAGGGGQLGHGDMMDCSEPTRIDPDFTPAHGLAMASCGDTHSLAVTRDGLLFGSGIGRIVDCYCADSAPDDPGLLGLDFDMAHLDHMCSFQQVDKTLLGGLKVIACAAGNRFSVALTSDGSLWTWGLNDAGQLGLASATQSSMVPLRMSRSSLEGACIGRCLQLSRDHAFAFAVGTHSKSLKSPVQKLAGKHELLAMIAEKAAATLPDHAADRKQLQGLLGGGVKADRLKLSRRLL